MVINFNNMKSVEYQFSRLCFKADVIEPLSDDDSFCIHTPDGSFKMTKREFYDVFPNVVKSKSYQEGRIYHYSVLPQKALKFLTDDTFYQKPINYEKSITHERLNTQKDLVGEEIREKIKEIGKLWRNSQNNLLVNKEILSNWNSLIEEWIENEDMPLIIRKDANKYKGQSFLHPSGREIIVSDNSFAIWVFGQAIKEKTYTLLQIKKMLAANEIPMVFMQTKNVMQYGKYTKPLGAYSMLGWKICHITPVGFNSNKSIEELKIEDIKNHFKKYASPSNMFALPKEIGDLGEIDAFIEEQK
jgi:hypothetical protein